MKFASKSWFKRIRRKIKRFQHHLFKVDLERILTLGFMAKMPQRQLTLGYLSYILVGTVLLMLPGMTNQNASFLDHLFTATSAVSTTGLSTVDVPLTYTFWGQLVILTLIQLGGLGYMTISSFVMYRTTKHFMQIKTGILKTEFAMPANISIKSMVHGIVGFTFLLEILGIAALYPMMLNAGAAQPLWSSVFHSISAFCTAGFSIYSDNLIQFQSHWGINLVIMFLSYSGAMGFIVMIDLWNKFKNPSYKISFTTWIIILVTLIISVWGTTQLFFFEPTIQGYPVADRLLISMFQTMSAMTTVGYNTIDLTNLIPFTLITLVVAMYFGASPSGTGGGLKSTTASAVYAFIKSKLGFERDSYLFGRRLPTYRVDTALSTFVLYTTILFLGAYALTGTETAPFDKLLFEAASALGTVGLTAGLTMHLTDAGQSILVLLMFIGRVGVLTIGNAMLSRMQIRTNEMFKKEEDLAI